MRIDKGPVAVIPSHFSFLNTIDYCGAFVKRHNYLQPDYLLKEYLYSYSKTDNGLFQDNLLNSFVKKNLTPRTRNIVTESVVPTVTFLCSKII